MIPGKRPPGCSPRPENGVLLVRWNRSRESSVLIINRISPFLLANVSFERKLIIMRGLLNGRWANSFHSFKGAHVYGRGDHSQARKEN